MLVAAALVPETALLIPGAAGAHRTLADERTAALEAVADLVSTGPDVVVVVIPGPPGSQVLELDGGLRPTLAAAGIADDVLGWRPASEVRDDVVDVTDVAAAVALLILGEVGWSGAARVLRVPASDGASLRERGRRLAAGSERVALLLSASLSARRGPNAPLAEDDRAASFDDAVLADLAELDPSASTRLAQIPSSVAAELAVSAWAPWQVLVGAAETGTGESSLRGTVRRVSAPLGATYAVLSWRLR